MSNASQAAAAHAASHRRRVFVGAVKLAFALCILSYIGYLLHQQGIFQRLVEQPKDWSRLALAQCLVLTAITLNYVRWYILVRALELDFTLRDAFRLGTIGLLLNQVSPGSVGG